MCSTNTNPCTGTVIGTATVSPTVSHGAASVSYALPAALAVGTYYIDAQYIDGSTGTYASSKGTATLTVTTVTIAPTSLTAITVGVAMTTQTITASGGTGPYTYAVTLGALPLGISLSPSGVTAGQLTGTATEGGSIPFTVTATDSLSVTGSQAYTWTVNPATIAIAPAAGALTATQGAAYSQAFTASGGTAPYTYAVSAGAVPTGTTFNTTTGVLSGTPTVAGPYSFSIKATDSSTGTGPYTVTNAYTLTVGAPTLVITPAAGALTAGTIGVVYPTVTFAASGGTAPYTWSLASGAVPAGMTFNAAAGTLSGTPTAAGAFSFSVKVTDSSTGTGAPFSKTNAYTLTINGPTIVVTPAAGALTAGTIGVAYTTVTFAASGGTSPYTWSLASGAVPAGMTFNAGAGTLSGTPTAAGAFSFSVKATDSSTGTGSPFSQTNAYTLTINGPTIVVTPAAGALTAGTVGVAYTTVTFAASGGTSPYTWSVSAGALPAGLTLSASAGTLSGTPTAAGAFSFSITATDSSTGTGSPFSKTNAYTLSVGAPTIVVTPAAGALTAATVGVAYTPVTFAATGGTSPYAWSVSLGALPAGMTLNAGTGVLSGTPTAAGAFSFSVKATDSSTGTGAPFSKTNAYTLTVNAPAIVVTPAAGALTAGTVGVAYTTVTFAATGGTSPYTWSLASGAVPAGMTFNAAAGTLSGTPTAAGAFSFSIKATDSSTGTGAPFSQTNAYTLTVNGATLSMTPAAGALTAGTAYVAYSQTFTASGGTAPYTYAVTAGALPAGLTLSTAGSLSGSPTASGPFSFTVTATDSSTGTGAPFTRSNAYTLTINAATITVTPATLPAAT
ncbi:MAG: putative Ig domain-containing protein, partial [Acidobacteriaceae bacterium]